MQDQLADLRDALLKQSRLKKEKFKGREVIVPADDKDLVGTEKPQVVDFARNPLPLGALTVRVAPREDLPLPVDPPQPQSEPPQP